MTLWGAVAMVTSAPFDNWWHNAYGLDVEILSPPHTVLAAGMYAVALGALLLVLSWQNRVVMEQGTASFLFVFTAGVLLAMSTIIVTEKSFPNQQHTGSFYKISCAIYPLYLVIAARASRLRWSATRAALIYMLLVAGMVWILPLFPARPQLAPIYNPVDHMVPPAFPLLLVVPALAIDFLVARFGPEARGLRDWMLAGAIGAGFLTILLAVQWFFSSFLLSSFAQNWLFAGGQHWPYFVQPGEWQNRYWRLNEDSITLPGLSAALGLAIIKSRMALWLANWMRNVKR